WCRHLDRWTKAERPRVLPACSAGKELCGWWILETGKGTSRCYPSGDRLQWRQAGGDIGRPNVQPPLPARPRRNIEASPNGLYGRPPAYRFTQTQKFYCVQTLGRRGVVCSRWIGCRTNGISPNVYV